MIYHTKSSQLVYESFFMSLILLLSHEIFQYFTKVLITLDHSSVDIILDILFLTFLKGLFLVSYYLMLLFLLIGTSNMIFVGFLLQLSIESFVILFCIL